MPHKKTQSQKSEHCGRKYPIYYYYGKGQTKRVGENYKPAGSGNSRAAEFKTTPDEVYDNGTLDNLLKITNGSDATDIDIADTPDNTILQFPVGRYDLHFQGYTAARSDNDFRVELRKIMSGKDDLLLTDISGRHTGTGNARTTFDLSYHDLEITDETDKVYLLFPSSGDKNRSHFLRIQVVN